MLLHRLEVMQFGHLLVIIMKLFVIMERHRVFETAAFLMREMAKSSIDYSLWYANIDLGFYSPTTPSLYTPSMTHYIPVSLLSFSSVATPHHPLKP